MNISLTLAGLTVWWLVASSPLHAQAQPPAPDLATLQAQAENGVSAAQFDLGNRYLYGDEVIADEFAAARWFRAAAEQGNNNAQYNLAVMYLQGTGVIADFNQALEWFRRAAEQGDPPAQFTLATLYANGRGVQQDPVQAHLWFSLAAAGGHRAAAANLVLYQEMMSDAQIAEAQMAAAEWIERFNLMNIIDSPSPANSDASVAVPRR